MTPREHYLELLLQGVDPDVAADAIFRWYGVEVSHVD